MWFLTFLLGVLTGVALVILGVWYFFVFFLNADKETDDGEFRKEPSSSTFQLPPALTEKISDESCKSKESCWAVNFVLYFLFRELRNSEGIRRWVLRKLALEFEELLAQTVLGKFFSSISIQNVDLGQNFPVLNWLKTSNVELHPVFKSISTVDILVDVDYSGGFQFAIQAETHLKHSAFLSVQFNGVKGQARLQFVTEPYAHWSFSFAENPDINISVVSQLYGKSFSHITTIIANQLKRSVRKKHTLPMYKIRYKPFFSRVEHIVSALVPSSAPRAETKGNLSVGVIEVRGLMASLVSGNIYARVAVSDGDWVAAYEEKEIIYLVKDLVHLKTGRRETNLDFTLGMANDIPVVESVMKKPGHEFEVGDEILLVDGKKANTVKQCVKNFKYSTSMKVIWRIRRRYFPVGLGKVEEAVQEHFSVPQSSQNQNPPSSETTSSALNLAEMKEKMDLPLQSTLTSASSGIGSQTTSVMGPSTPGDTEQRELSESRRSSSGFIFRTSLQNSHQCQVFSTKEVPSSRDPIFGESFSMKVEESQRFLNLGVWSEVKPQPAEESSVSESVPSSGPSSSPSSSPSKKSKNAVVTAESVTFNHHRLVGTISIPLADIIAECSATGMGYFVKDYYLRSPDGSAVDAKEIPLVSYSGFEPHMCYGKISLSFQFKTDEEINSKRRDSTESVASNIPVEIATDALSEPMSPTDEYQTHQFVRTNFRRATVCDYCNKKIWLKEAFGCRVCHMKCHKKCNDRCIANTICRGEGFYPPIPNVNLQQAPEIIMTGDNEEGSSNQNQGDDLNVAGTSSQTLHPSSTPNTNGVRRRTLGGLLVSAVQNRSVQLTLRRTGSATNLLSPNQNSSSSTRSLPPSPKASPTTSRKVSCSSASAIPDLNPFEVLDVETDINTAVENLLRHPNEDLISVAKTSGRDVYSHLELTERKKKLNEVLNRLQEEIDLMSTKRMELSREEMSVAPQAKAAVTGKIEECEERVQALALLMLFFCAGLQQVQDLEEMEKEEEERLLIINESQSLEEAAEDDEDEDDD